VSVAELGSKRVTRNCLPHPSLGQAVTSDHACRDGGTSHAVNLVALCAASRINSPNMNTLTILSPTCRLP
jgi:hypothetical protein